MKYLETVRASLAEKIEARNGLVGELEAITEAAATEERSELSDDETVAFDEARATIGELDTEIAALTEREADLAKVSERQTASAAAVRDVNINVAGITADPYDVELRSLPRTVEARRDVAERARKIVGEDPSLDDDNRHNVDRLLRKSDRGGELSSMIVATGRPEYRSAFAKVTSQVNPILTTDEARAVEEVRAMTAGTDATGGYAMPFQLDPTFILTSDGNANPMRQLANTITVPGDNWQGVSTAGVTASWDAESAEVSDDTPTLAQPAIAIHKAAAFVPFTIEAEDDLANLGSEIARLFMDAKDNLEAAAFITGSGSGQPEGIVTGLVAGSSITTSATTDTYAVADVYATANAVGARWRSNASWLMSYPVINLTRAFGTAVAHTFLTDLGGGQPPDLLGSSLYEASSLDSSITGSADNYIAVFGDINSAYTIADRVGLTVELVPHLFGTNYRPTGERGWYARWRVGAAVVNDPAAQVLNVT